MTRRWTENPSFFCELLRRQGCNPCRLNCKPYCLDVFHDVVCEIPSILAYARSNMNNCPFCRKPIPLEYRRAHLCESFPPLGRKQLLSWNVPEAAFNKRQLMPHPRSASPSPVSSPSPTRSEIEIHEHKRDSDREDEKTPDDDETSRAVPLVKLIAPDTFWPFEQVFVGRRFGHRKVNELLPARPACFEISCTKLYCIPEAHWTTRECTTPAGDMILLGAYLAAFPNRCPYCFREFRWASTRLLHECGLAPWPYCQASDYQKDTASWFAQQKIERRGRAADKRVAQKDNEKTCAADRITSHLKWCASSCGCENCVRHKSAGHAKFIIVRSVLGDLHVTRPPMLREPPSITRQHNNKKRSASHQLSTPAKRIKWQYKDSCTSGGCGIGGTNGKGPRRKPWVMRNQPVRSQQFAGTDVVPLEDKGFVELSGFD